MLSGLRPVEAEDQTSRAGRIHVYQQQYFVLKLEKLARTMWSLSSPTSLLITQRDATKTAPDNPG